MPAVKTAYLCQQCGGRRPNGPASARPAARGTRWSETVAAPRSATRQPPSAARAMAGLSAVTPIGAVESAEAARLSSGLGEVDRVLGGGFVPGSIALFGGDPGHRQVDAAASARRHAWPERGTRRPVRHRRGVGRPGSWSRRAGRRRGGRPAAGGDDGPRDGPRRDRGDPSRLSRWSTASRPSPAVT